MADEEEGLSCSDRDLKRVLKRQAMDAAGDFGGELIELPWLSADDSPYKVGDAVVYQFPQRVREHSEELAEFRGTGRIVKIHPGYGERWMEVQALEEGLSADPKENPPFTLSENSLAPAF